MSSPFDPSEQNRNLDAKIIASLEKISEVFRVMLWEAGKKYNLSPIQVQVLVFLAHHDPSRARVTLLSNEFNLTKPTMSEVVQALREKKLIEKVSDESDSRTFSLVLTSEGRSLAEKLSGFARPMEISMKDLTDREKEEVFSGLYKLLSDLSSRKVIGTLRHCAGCAFFEGTSVVSWCSSYQKALSEKDMLVDCESYSEKKQA